MFGSKLPRVLTVLAGSFAMAAGVHAFAQQDFFTKEDVINTRRTGKGRGSPTDVRNYRMTFWTE